MFWWCARWTWRNRRTEWLVAKFPAAFICCGDEQANQILLREDLKGRLRGGFRGQRGDHGGPPGIAVLVGAEDTSVLGGFGV